MNLIRRGWSARDAVRSWSERYFERAWSFREAWATHREQLAEWGRRQRALSALSGEAYRRAAAEADAEIRALTAATPVPPRWYAPRGAWREEARRRLSFSVPLLDGGRRW